MATILSANPQCEVIIAGGVEASLRRLAHFDYWSETGEDLRHVVRRLAIGIDGFDDHLQKRRLRDVRMLAMSLIEAALA